MSRRLAREDPRPRGSPAASRWPQTGSENHSWGASPSRWPTMRWVGEDQHRPGRGASARCGPVDQISGAPGTDTPLPPGDKAPWPSSPAPRSSGRKEPAGRRSRPYRIATDSASRPTTAEEDDSHQNAEAITAVATTATPPPYPTITGTSPTALTAAASRSSTTGEEAGNSSGTPSLVPDQPHPRRGPPGEPLDKPGNETRSQ